MCQRHSIYRIRNSFCDGKVFTAAQHIHSKHTINITTIYSVFMNHDIMRLLDELQYHAHCSRFTYTYIHHKHTLPVECV